MITGREITVVVQGPVVPCSDREDAPISTKACLASVRQILPEAHIVLSTWKGSNLDGLDFDEVVESDDPGGLLENHNCRYNINRQIVSTRNGLARAVTPYSLKMRSDCSLCGTGFLDYFSQNHIRSEKFKVFSRRLVCCDLFFRTPWKQPFSLIFHPSDVFQFGLTEDLQILWSPKLATESEVHLSDPTVLPFMLRECWRNPLYRYSEEQYLWIQCLRNSGIDASLQCCWEMTSALVHFSESSILNNYLPVAAERLGVILPKRFYRTGPKAVYSYEDFIKLNAIYTAERSPTLRCRLHVLGIMALYRLRSLANLRLRVFPPHGGTRKESMRILK
jgi:hypothetical protein